MHASLGQHHLVERRVQFAVAHAREPVPAHPSRGDLDRRAAGVACELGVGGEAVAAGLDQEARRDQVADAGDRQQARGKRADQRRDLGPQRQLGTGDLADPGQQLLDLICSIAPDRP